MSRNGVRWSEINGGSFPIDKSVESAKKNFLVEISLCLLHLCRVPAFSLRLFLFSFPFYFCIFEIYANELSSYMEWQTVNDINYRTFARIRRWHNGGVTMWWPKRILEKMRNWGREGNKFFYALLNSSDKLGTR